MGTDFPIGPLGVPSNVFNDLWRSRGFVRMALVAEVT